MASIEEEETPLLANSVPEENQRSRRHKILGVFFCLLSSLIFACYNLAVKTWKLDFIDVLCVRATIQIIAFGILAKCLSQKFWPEREVGISSRRYHLEGFLLLFQGICAGLTACCSFVAVTSSLPLGDALTLFFSQPLSTMVLSAVIFGHRLRLYKITFAIILITGIILVIQPPQLFPHHHKENNATYFSNDLNEEAETAKYVGVIAALGGALFSSSLTIGVSYLRHFEKNVLVFYGGVGGFILVLLVHRFDAGSKIFHDFGEADLPKIIIAAFIATFGNFMAIKSYQMIPPTMASFVRTQEVVFSFILQTAVMGIVPSIYSVIGAFLVITSAVLLPFEAAFLAVLPNDRLKSIF